MSAVGVEARSAETPQCDPISVRRRKVALVLLRSNSLGATKCSCDKLLHKVIVQYYYTTRSGFDVYIVIKRGDKIKRSDWSKIACWILCLHCNQAWRQNQAL